MKQEEFDTMARAMGVTIPLEYAAGVAEQWGRFATAAKGVIEVELPLEVEPAPVFDASMHPHE